MGAVVTQCTFRRSPTTIASVSLSFSFAIRTTHTKRIQQESMRARERELVGPTAHATSYWKRASQAKPAKQRRECDTKAKQQNCWHKERDAWSFLQICCFAKKNKILTIKKQQQRQQPLPASPPGFTQRQILEIEQLSLSHKHTDKHTRTHVMGNNKNKQKAT